MRKGILALSKAGKGKAPAKKSTQTPEPAEIQVLEQALPDEEAPLQQEKLFVQTIQIPKPGTVVKKGRKSKKIPYTGM